MVTLVMLGVLALGAIAERAEAQQYPDCQVEGSTARATGGLSTRDGVLYAFGGPCGSLSSIDTVHLAGIMTNFGGHALVNVTGGLLAPGLTAEPDGSSEIEIDVTVPTTGALALFTLEGASFHTPEGPDDDFVIGQSGSTSLVNLNAATDGSSPDYDVTIQGANAITVNGDAGRDRIRVSADPATSPIATELTLIGRYDADDLVGGDADDLLVGEGGDDRMRGRGGADVLFGGNGSDVSNGGPGSDEIDGMRGDDVLVGGDGRDKILGDHHEDVIDAADGQVDRVDCGGGKDRVEADAQDLLFHCERKDLR